MHTILSWFLPNLPETLLLFQGRSVVNGTSRLALIYDQSFRVTSYVHISVSTHDTVHPPFRLSHGNPDPGSHNVFVSERGLPLHSFHNKSDLRKIVNPIL